jgi:HK97 family phage portal protein
MDFHKFVKDQEVNGVGLRDWVANLALKSARAAYFMSSMGGGAPTWSGRDYQAYIDEGFSKIVWVYASVRAIYQTMASVPWVAYQMVPEKSSKARESKEAWRRYQRKMALRHLSDPATLDIKSFDLEELEFNHPLNRLLRFPNPHMTWGELMEATALYLNLGGRCYWEKVKGGGKTQEVYAIRPDRIKPVGANKEFIKQYELVDQGRVVERFNPEDIVYFRMPHPLDERGGFSPVMPAARTIDTENAVNDWNKVFFENSAVPKGIIVAPQRPDPKTKEEMRQEWRILQGGIKNAHKSAILWGGVEYKELGKSHSDMEFEALKHMTREEIAAAFGVPPVIVGIWDKATYSNFEEATQSFWELTIVPQLARVRARANMSIAMEFGEQFYLDYDLSNVEALQENANEKVTRLVKATGGAFLKPNEARQEFGYDPDPDFDVVYYALGAATEPPKPQEEEAPSEGGGEDSPKPKDDGDKGFKAMTEEEAYEARTRHWEAKERQRQQWDRTLQRRIIDMFEYEFGTIKNVANDTTDPVELEQAIDSLFDDEFKSMWLQLVAQNVTEVVDYFGKQTWDELTKGNTPVTEHKWNLWDKVVRKWVEKFVAKEVTNVTDTTRESIREIVRTDFEAGMGIVATVGHIEGLYLDNIIPNRSLVIARTETHAASMSGSWHAASQTGVKMRKVWVSSRDAHVRDTHLKMDGQAIPIEDLWDVNGSKMKFPGDGSHGAAAREVINCRCDHMYEVV